MLQRQPRRDRAVGARDVAPEPATRHLLRHLGCIRGSDRTRGAVTKRNKKRNGRSETRRCPSQTRAVAPQAGGRTGARLPKERNQSHQTHHHEPPRVAARRQGDETGLRRNGRMTQEQRRRSRQYYYGPGAERPARASASTAAPEVPDQQQGIPTSSPARRTRTSSACRRGRRAAGTFDVYAKVTGGGVAPGPTPLRRDCAPSSRSTRSTARAARRSSRDLGITKEARFKRARRRRIPKPGTQGAIPPNWAVFRILHSRCVTSPYGNAPDSEWRFRASGEREGKPCDR
jgi:hypothetical protein